MQNPDSTTMRTRCRNCVSSSSKGANLSRHIAWCCTWCLSIALGSPHCPSSSSGSSCMEFKSGADWLTLSRPWWPGRCRHTPHVAAFAPAAELKSFFTHRIVEVIDIRATLHIKAHASSAHSCQHITNAALKSCIRPCTVTWSGHKFGCRRGRALRHQRTVVNCGSLEETFHVARPAPFGIDWLALSGPCRRGHEAPVAALHRAAELWLARVRPGATRGQLQSSCHSNGPAAFRIRAFLLRTPSCL